MKLKYLLLYSGLTITGFCMLAGCGRRDNSSDSASTDIAITENIAGNTDSVVETSDKTVSNTIQDTNSNAVVGIIKEQFLSEIASDSDITSVANKLIENKVFSEIAMGTMPVSEGLLDGFDGEIKGFDKGVKFSPMIGSIPFIGYIFETDSPQDLVKILEDKSQLNWNICTVADEKITVVEDKYVLFVMAPHSFE